MSLPVATTISGIDSLAVLRQNLAVARGFVPMSPADMRALRERCAAFAADGHLEPYKSTKRYDGTVGREQHGYPPPSELPLQGSSSHTGLPSSSAVAHVTRPRGA
jgi:hypothetical protein